MEPENPRIEVFDLGKEFYLPWSQKDLTEKLINIASSLLLIMEIAEADAAKIYLAKIKTRNFESRLQLTWHCNLAKMPSYFLKGHDSNKSLTCRAFPNSFQH
jgi:hypothetical protein